MRINKLTLLAFLCGSSPAWAAAPAVTAESLALAAFKSPTVPFEAKLFLSEWRDGQSSAEEVRLFFSPPNAYRLEFLSFDGSVKKIILTDEKNVRVLVPSLEKSSLLSGPLQLSPILSPKEVEALLRANYTFELKSAETFIGRPVYVLHLVPRTPGKPMHELRIDKETLVVLEQRRYVAKDGIGSLTRFSSFEPNKVFASDVFAMTSTAGLVNDKTDLAPAPDTATAPPPESFRNLPAGFSLSSYRTFEVEGTTANHFSYTDGALPLSVFETKLPVHFPANVPASDKLAIVPSQGLSSADQVVYGKKGKHYFTIIGEVSPDLLHTIANHFN